MSRKFKVPLNLVGLTTDPGSATNGDLYFNTTSNKVRYYTNSAWQDLGAAAGGASVQVSTTIPAIATEGKLWYDNDDARLYVYDGTYWVEVSIGPVGPAGPTGAGVATAGTTGQYLVKSSNNNYETTWSTLPAASLTSTDVSRLTGATSNLQTQINTLSTNLGNTLDDYVPIGDVGVADGVASLDSSGKIPIAQLGNLIDGAPAALDTLNELAAAINDDSSYASTITTALGNKVSKAGGDIITSSLSSVIPLVLKGTASQSADLQQWHNSAGTLMARVAFDGSFTAGGYNGATKFIVDQFGTLSLGTNRNISGTPTYLFVQSQGATDIGAVIKAAASQTADLQQWQNSTGTVLSSITSFGGARLYDLGVKGGPEGIAWAYFGNDNTSTKNVVVRGFASQTANLQEWQNSAGSILARISPSGSGLFAGGLDLSGSNGGIIGGGGLTCIILGTNRNIQTGSTTPSYGGGQSVIGIANATVVPTTNPTGGGVLYVESGALKYRGASGIAMQLESYAVGDKPLIIKGFASQTANLQEWSSNSGTVLAKITASGALDATAITVNGAAITGGLTPVAVSTNITMAANNRYFVDTTSARTLTLPITPALGAEIELYDSSNNAFTNNVSIVRNGEKINGLTDDAALDINGFAVSFIYTGSTYGWRIK